ncbi:histidine decarboxylase [soil metagenome]
MNAPALSPEDRRRLDDLYDRLLELRDKNIGYPCNQEFDYSELFRFLQFSVNNVGDPFSGSNYRLNTQDFEREVVAEFAKFTQAPDDDWWGYVTSGGTEGNMYGLFLGRETYPEGICYFSEDTHYSVAKILRLQHTRSLMLHSQPNGEMDYEDLRESLRIHRDAPPIIFANIGTTMKGAADNLLTIRSILDELSITQAYVHADAALSGMILPFVDDAPPWNFAAGADSVAISGHKMLGSPLPCGVVVARKKHVDRIARSIEYIGALDTTIAGSRSAVAPLMLWYRLRTLGHSGIRDSVQSCLQLAEYAATRLCESGIKAWRHKNSVTVVFPKPPESIMRKWILAPNQDICHLIVMPHVTQSIIDAFVDDLVSALKETCTPSLP